MTKLKMKVLLINGSPRKGGNTQIALEEVAKTLQNEGVEAEIVAIGTVFTVWHKERLR